MLHPITLVEQAAHPDQHDKAIGRVPDLAAYGWVPVTMVASMFTRPNDDQYLVINRILAMFA